MEEIEQKAEAVLQISPHCLCWSLFGNYLCVPSSLCSFWFHCCPSALQPQQPVLWAPSTPAAGGQVHSLGAVCRLLCPPCVHLQQRGGAVLPASCFKHWLIIYSAISQGRDDSLTPVWIKADIMEMFRCLLHVEQLDWKIKHRIVLVINERLVNVPSMMKVIKVVWWFSHASLKGSSS